jgi:hypothetical protein
VKKSVTRILTEVIACAGIILCGTALSRAFAQGVPAYLNTNLPAEQRAVDLVHRLTLEEKASQLTNYSRAIPRLKVPSYDWWSEALHGVATNGITEFPEPIGLGATFDPDAIHQMATVIGVEGRIKHAQFVRQNGGFSNTFQGLDFWAPNLNIFRDPRWGRGQETYGEDPFLTGRMGVAFVTGMQGDDPRYYRATASMCRSANTMNWIPICPHSATLLSKARPVRSCAHITTSTANPPAQVNFCFRTSSATSGSSRATLSPIAALSTTFMRTTITLRTSLRLQPFRCNVEWTMNVSPSAL